MVTARPNIHNILILVLVSLICLASAADEDHHDEPHVRVLLGSLDKVEPEYGPRSGGTRVSLLGRHLLDPSKHDNVRVTLHEAGASYNCIVEDSSRSDRIVAITPGHKGVEDTVELRLDVFYSNDTEKGSYRSSFSYRPDPVVHEVHPNSVIAAGGVTLTVVGRNIDSVRTPVLASAVLRRGVTTRKPPNQQAYFVNSTCAKFRVPALTEQAYDITPEEAMDYKILVGFVFDGVQYLNHTFLEVEGNPVVQSWEPRVLNFSQDGDENIRVDVNWPPNSHISDDDISILIGTRKCLDLHRNGSQLICTPPSVPEPVILNGPESISKPTVTVRIGYLETYVGTIIYYLPGGIHIIILIMSAILAFMFLVALVFGCIALCSGRREAKKPTHKERSSISYVPVDDLDEMARRRSRVRLSKDSTVDIPLQFQRNRTSSDASTTSGRAPGEKGGDQPLHKIEELGEPQKGDTKIVFKDMLKENNNESKK